MLVTTVPVELDMPDDKTRLVEDKLACVVIVDEADTDEGGVSMVGPAKLVLGIIKPVFGGLGCISG